VPPIEGVVGLLDDDGDVDREIPPSTIPLEILSAFDPMELRVASSASAALLVAAAVALYPGFEPDAITDDDASRWGEREGT